jgi:hypothetical protein
MKKIYVMTLVLSSCSALFAMDEKLQIRSARELKRLLCEARFDVFTLKTNIHTVLGGQKKDPLEVALYIEDTVEKYNKDQSNPLLHQTYQQQILLTKLIRKQENIIAINEEALNFNRAIKNSDLPPLTIGQEKAIEKQTAALERILKKNKDALQLTRQAIIPGMNYCIPQKMIKKEETCQIIKIILAHKPHAIQLLINHGIVQ